MAALNGHTFAAGLFMAAHMDFRFMREDRGWVCMPEIDINIPLLPGMIAICQAVMTPKGFRRLYYTGARFTGPEAMDLGRGLAKGSDSTGLRARSPEPGITRT